MRRVDRLKPFCGVGRVLYLTKRLLSATQTLYSCEFTDCQGFKGGDFSLAENTTRPLTV